MPDLDKSILNIPDRFCTIRRLINQNHHKNNNFHKKTEIETCKIIDQFSAGIFIVNKNGTIIFWNKEIEKMTGKLHEDMLGRFVYEIPFNLFCDDEGENQKDLQFIFNFFDRNFIKEYEIRDITQAKQTIQIYFHHLHFDGEELYVCIFHNISKLNHVIKNMEKKLNVRTKELEELNGGLKVLLKYSNQEKEIIEQSVLTNIKSRLLPLIKKFESSGLTHEQKEILNSLETSIVEITTPFLKNVFSTYNQLTIRELEIISLLKGGKTNREISDFLFITIDTVAFHRKNIRKKLGLVKRSDNLISFLQKIQLPDQDAG